jgi:hypothetical protein
MEIEIGRLFNMHGKNIMYTKLRLKATWKNRNLETQRIISKSMKRLMILLVFNNHKGLKMNLSPCLIN